ncbi:MAG: DUF1778 domain-containing protein [Methylobacter tundripaludum]|nr:DUF1778 domain-containing protein [Methylobacter tundripaludum]MCK9635457.1 DUF1778 domain-containing protein [Methylobacter tundripaludum]
MATQNDGQDFSEIEKTRFSEDDWRMFLAMADNPPEPTERMKKAALTYKSIIEDSEDG